MTRILVDIFKINDPHTGLGQFSMRFAEALIAHERADQEVTFLMPRGLDRYLLQGHARIEDGAYTRYWPGANRRFDLWHSLHQFPFHHPPRGTRSILTVHDLNFLIEKSGAKGDRYLSKLQRNLDRAVAVTAISDFTKAQLEQHTQLCGKPVHVIHNGTTLVVHEGAPLPAGVGGRPYFLAIGVLKETKNIHALVPLMAHFPDHDLVIAGNDRTAYGEEIRRLIAASPSRERIQMLGNVDDRTRSALYAHCEALLFPSLAEGFGLPVIEALSMGRPVFASATTSVPEIGGDVAMYFNDFAPEHMATVIMQGLSTWGAQGAEASERARRHAQRFTWEQCIARYQQLYAEVLG